MFLRPLGIRLKQNPSQRKENCLARGKDQEAYGLLGGREQGGHVFVPRGLSKLDARTKGSPKEQIKSHQSEALTTAVESALPGLRGF